MSAYLRLVRLPNVFTALAEDDEIGALQFGDQIIDLRFAVNPVFAARRVVGHAYAHPHLGNVAPAADFLGGLLCFQIEIYNVLCHGAQIYDL